MCLQRSLAYGLNCATHQIFRVIAGYCAISTNTSCQSLALELIKKAPVLYLFAHTLRADWNSQARGHDMHAMPL